MMSELHRRLRDVLYCVVEYFAPVLFFAIGNYVTSLPMSVYVMYERLKDFRRFAGVTVMFHIGCTSHWALYPVIVLVVLSIVCGSASEEVSVQIFSSKEPVSGFFQSQRMQLTGDVGIIF